MRAAGGDDVRSHGEVGDELAVHDVPLDPVAAGRLQRGDLVTETGEVRGEHRRGDLDTRCRRFGTVGSVIGAGR